MKVVRKNVNSLVFEYFDDGRAYFKVDINASPLFNVMEVYDYIYVTKKLPLIRNKILFDICNTTRNVFK